jgi:ribosomal protein S18 acetylase RimI-like enzyme
MPLLRRPEPALIYAPYERRYRSGVRDLLVTHDHTHLHLDWHDTSLWLDTEPAVIRLALQNNRVIGVLAASAPLNQTSWIRMAAVINGVDPRPLLNTLWSQVSEALRLESVAEVAWLMLHEWTIPYAAEMGFQFAEEIITLRRASQQPPDTAPHPDILIRPIRQDDLQRVSEVDQAAFAPPWQMSLSDVRQAERHASNCTVALREGQIVGYQLSTLYFDGAHLARLAVDPGAQGMGVGSALVGEVLRHFHRRGVHAMTVNTQMSNLVSQAIYHKYGFQRTGYDLPTWIIRL